MYIRIVSQNGRNDNHPLCVEEIPQRKKSSTDAMLSIKEAEIAIHV